MNTRGFYSAVSADRWSRRRLFSVLALLTGCLFILPGCLHLPTTVQNDADAQRDKDLNCKTIGDVTGVANAEPIPITGVGLVVGLENTGGNAGPSGYRTLVEDQLRKRGVNNVKEILASRETSIVLVTALIPAGAHKDDPLDIEVTLPPQSKTTSLRGGYLQECLLKDFNFTKTLDPSSGGSNRVLAGHTLGVASGPLLVGFGPGDATSKVKEGRIWGGGRSKIDRPFYLALNSDQQRAPVAQQVALRVNETLQGNYRGVVTELATAKNNQVIVLRVPVQYKLNLPRYLRVVRLIPLQANPTPSSAYVRRLAEDLLDPQQTVTSALRLEALGTSSIQLLKRGLKSDHALVRFCSAEALAYLGDPACGEELAHVAEQQPILRAFSFTALASLDESICHVKLRSLLACPSSEARYGAFRALRALDEHDPNVQGEHFNDSFWLHRVATDSPPLVHVSCTRRPEVVLFGQDSYLVPPFSFLAGEFTVTSGQDDRKCTVTRMSVHHGTLRRQCSLSIEELLRTMADMGSLYPDVVELLQQAGSCETLSCKVAFDALPQATSVYTLAKDGAKDLDFVETDQEILDAQSEFGSTPTLFEKTSRHGRSELTHDDEAALRDRKPANEKKSAQREVSDE